jgi:hypothetical protein
MRNRLKYPLSIYVVWHPKFNEGKTIAKEVYSIFCRDTERPLSRGLGIPVYFRSASCLPIDQTQATRNAVILLVDELYMTDADLRAFTESTLALCDDNTRVYPVALCDQAFGIGCGLTSIQFVRPANGHFNIKEDFALSMKKLKTELLHDCARLLMNFRSIWMDSGSEDVPSPVKLFLSHAKRDGEKTTRLFKAFVDAEMKLDVFFDTVDIADGYQFEQQIETNIKNSALVVFHTDEYSAREWCRIEVLIAKRNKCSIVVVHDIKDGERRAFPYLGNTPTITLKQDEIESFFQIVNLTLYQVLNNRYQLELLESFKGLFEIPDTEFIGLSSPPELFNYIDIYRKKSESHHKLIVLYPEPPLGAEELKILNEIDRDIKFITPIHLPTLI